MGKSRSLRGTKSLASSTLSVDTLIQSRKRPNNENSFELLGQLDKNEPRAKQAAINNQSAPNSKSTKPPPITVNSTSVAYIHKTIVNVGVVRYTTKPTRHGTIVQVDEVKDYKKVINTFKERNVSYHSYQLEEDKTTKVVLHGLFDLPTNEVTELLKEENIFPVEVKKLPIKNKKYDEHAVYILHFPKGTVSLQLLKNIRAVNHCRVNWEYFSSKPGPMQCKRCKLFGHGAANCNRAKKCYLCAGEHDSIICPLTAGSSAGDGRVPAHKLKCANCDGNHTARFHECSQRPVPVAKNTTHTNRKFAPCATDFPSLPQKPPLQRWTQRVQTNTNQQRYANTNNDLFDRTEILPIIEEVICNLAPCKSKQEQLMTIFAIVTKYCMPSK